MRVPLFSLAACLLLAPQAALAGGKATLGDRAGQVFATFIGDPAANVDIDMKHVLDKWRSLNPKPLETLTPAEARRQPAPINAAGDLAAAERRPLDPAGVTVREITIPGPAGPPRWVAIPTASRSPARGPAPSLPPRRRSPPATPGCRGRGRSC